MGTYSEAFFNLIDGFKNSGILEYQYYDFSKKEFATGAQSRICHVEFQNEPDRNKDAVLMVFTIGSNSGRVVIQSEGKTTTNPSSAYPQKIEAVKLAHDTNWKYFAIAISAEDFANTTIRDYVVAIESSSYGAATICVLDDCISALTSKGLPDFYRCKQKASNNVVYTISFIKKSKFVDYLLFFDNRFDNIDWDDDNEEKYKSWLGSLKKSDGSDRLSKGSIDNYIRYPKKNFSTQYEDRIAPYSSVFQINTVDEFDRVINPIVLNPGETVLTESSVLEPSFSTFNADTANGKSSIKASLILYREFLSIEDRHAKFQKLAHNRILFGAPGTGKSFRLNKERKGLLYGDPAINEKALPSGVDYGYYERVTFHPDYSYAHFVGTYKPAPDIADPSKITYKFVPGPFIRVYVQAIKNKRKAKDENKDAKPAILVIEEINRANVAAVFGDVFQLLDRNYGESEYPIQTSEDLKRYLSSTDVLGGVEDDYRELILPENMFIWATMNSADQGVFPMDTAFKRRWDFTYIGIDENDCEIQGKTVAIGKGTYRRTIEWNKLRKEINSVLSKKIKVNEDKLLGPYFLSSSIVPNKPGEDIAEKSFASAFKNKVLMYLYDDAARGPKKSELFASDVDTTKYSKVCDAFDDRGVFIFCSDISSNFNTDDSSGTTGTLEESASTTPTE